MAYKVFPVKAQIMEKFISQVPIKETVPMQSGRHMYALEQDLINTHYFITLKFIINSKIVMKTIEISEIQYHRLKIRDLIKIKVYSSYFNQLLIKKIVII